MVGSVHDHHDDDDDDVDDDDDDEPDDDWDPNNKTQCDQDMSLIFGVYVISQSLLLAWKAMALSYEQMNRNRSTVPNKTGEEKVC